MNKYERYSSPKPGRLRVSCGGCGIELYVTLSLAKRGARFCSQSCYFNWRSSNRVNCGPNNPKWTRRIVGCQQCGTEFAITKKRENTARFCSRKCLAANKTANQSGRNSPYWNRIEQLCTVCNDPYLVKPSHARFRKTCGNPECVSERVSRQSSGEGNASWLGGLSRLPYPHIFNARLKRAIRKRDGNVCQLCGKTEEQNGQALTIHHIDYEKSNCEDRNLIAVCRPCNSKVNINRESWTKFFQLKIRGIYGI